jgi:two-component system sensor histidine kinase BaeS
MVWLAPDSIVVCNPGHIPEEDLPRIFDRLYRGDAGRSGSGNGLGLSITRVIAEKHGWRITAENRETDVCTTIELHD